MKKEDLPIIPNLKGPKPSFGTAEELKKSGGNSFAFMPKEGDTFKFDTIEELVTSRVKSEIGDKKIEYVLIACYRNDKPSWINPSQFRMRDYKGEYTNEISAKTSSYSNDFQLVEELLAGKTVRCTSFENQDNFKWIDGDRVPITNPEPGEPKFELISKPSPVWEYVEEAKAPKASKSK